MSVIAGTSGWQYRDWRGAFYPPGVPQRRWRERVTSDFVKAVKASRYLTHVRGLRDAAAFAAAVAGRGRATARAWSGPDG